MINFISASIDFTMLYPELVLLVGAFIILVSVFNKKASSVAPYIALLALVGSAIFAVEQWSNPLSGFYGMNRIDNFSVVFNIIFIFTSFLALLIAKKYLQTKNIERPEFYALLLFSTVGMMVMVNTTDLVVIFLGLEIMSVPLYVMAGFNQRSLISNEAGIKYFIMGAFASGFLLLGIAFIFGASGTTDLWRLKNDITYTMSHSGHFLVTGIILILVGFAFKVGAVPFHSWIPDVYQGAPTPVTAFFSVGPKAAGFAALMRIFVYGFGGIEFVSDIFWVLAVLTMLIGNIFALRQENVKRMLAYSSIAHAGYILVAFTVGGTEAMSSAIFYLIAYAMFNLGGFTVVTLLETRTKAKSDFSELPGMAKAHPYLAAVLALFMFALSGFPPTVGFIGKFYIFSAAVKNGFIILAVIGVLNSFISVYYYLRVIKAAYFDSSETEFTKVNLSPAIIIVLVITVLGTLGIGLFPQKILTFASEAIFAFL